MPPTPTTARAAIPTIEPGVIRLPEAPTEPGAEPRTLELEVTSLDGLAGTLPATGLPFQFLPPNIGTRKRLGQVQGNAEHRKFPARLTAHYLAACLSSLGGESMPDLKPDVAALKVAALPVGDVIALALAWKASAHPRGVNIGESRCGACNADFAQVLVKLGELETLAAPMGEGGRRVDDLVAAVGLYQGFPYPAGQTVRTVLVRPPRWIDTWWELGANGWHNPELLRACVLRAAILAVDTGPVARLPESAIDGIYPDDQELIDQALGKITPTPNTEITIPCPVCQAENAANLDWMSAGFLSGSSRG